MRRRLLDNVHLRVFAALAASLLGCTGDPAGSAVVQDQNAYLAELAEWKAGRVATLKGPTGFLNLVGLFWLRHDVSTFGSSPDSNFVLPDEKLAVRVRDFDNPAIEAFKPIKYFPVDRSFRVAAMLRRFDEPRQLRVDTVITGLDWRPQSPGQLKFEFAGESYELEAYNSGDELFMVFGDLTNSRGTYPAGRFLYASMPDESGLTILDFNKAYNPPCAYNEFATCPVASPQNRLKTRILAGEQFDSSVHVPGSAP